ncbi:MAG TPA: hypothetical protein V6D22_23535 [Candidatus Obscuribacterales bacterium]
MRKPSDYLVIGLLAAVSLTPDAVCTNIDALQKSVGKNLSLAEARSTLVPSEAVRLRHLLNAAIKKRQQLQNSHAGDGQIIAQMQQIQHEIDLANQRAVASRGLRFF